MAGTATLEEAFEDRPNALDALRLLLATLVVVWHALLLTTPLTGVAWPVRQLLEELPVDAFFAVSGLLITRAWFRRRNTADFVAARLLRILPGLWVCLAVTAFVLVPMAGQVTPGDQWGYLARHALVLGPTPSVDGYGTDSWNLSLWTLWWEVVCYLGVVALAWLGWLRGHVLLGVALGCWMVALLLAPLGDPPGVAWFDAFPRLGLMFCCGALLWLARSRIRFHAALGAGAAAVTAAASALPDYRLLAAPAVAYFVIWLGVALGRWPVLILRYDVSYGVYIYGFPVQQMLLATGAASTFGSLSGLSALIVLPMAAASCVLVERPAMRLRRSLQPTRSSRIARSSASSSLWWKSRAATTRAVP